MDEHARQQVAGVYPLLHNQTKIIITIFSVLIRTSS